MKRSQEIRFIHWLAVKMNNKQALSFLKFRHQNKKLLEEWAVKHSDAQNLPPIYWDSRKGSWVWDEFACNDMRRYFQMCSTMLLVRRVS